MFTLVYMFVEGADDENAIHFDLRPRVEGLSTGKVKNDQNFYFEFDIVN